MRYIIGGSREKWNEEWEREIARDYEGWGALIEADDEKIEKLQEKGYWIEPDFEVSFGSLTKEVDRFPARMKKHILFATLGEYVDDPHITYYYEVKEQRWRNSSSTYEKVPWICCYSKEKIHVSGYLNCIDVLHRLAEKLNLKLVIIGNITSDLPYFKYRSLADVIVNQYLEKYKSIYIQHARDSEVLLYGEPSKRTYEPYKNLIYYGEIASEKVNEKLMASGVMSSSEIQMRQPERLLYEDNFYERIPPNQIIYVPLNLFNNKNCDYYKNLDVNTVCIGTHYTFLYDERQKIDAIANQIRNQVLPTYVTPILSPVPIERESIDEISSYRQLGGDIKYRGKEVYIGIIGTQGVDYEQDFLKDANGRTRIAHIWEQSQGNEGIYYTEEQINSALAAGNPQNIVPLEHSETNETIILEVAAGKDEFYEGIATESQFIVAKIKSAPPSISKIYGGVAREESALMPDILVAISKMVELAQLGNRPIVIYIPYNTNISAHNGTSIYEEILSEFAMEQGVSIIVPAGEEANKEHHAVLKPNPLEEEQITFEVGSDVEQVVGIIYMNSIQRQPFLLISPNQNIPAIRLDKKAVSRIDNVTVYSTGIQNDYQDGSKYILFSLNQMASGSWKFTWEKQENASGYMDLWLAQEQLNPYVTLRPSSPFVTLGSNAAVDNMMSVAAFNLRDLVVVGSSGRGYAWDGSIRPIAASQHMSVIRYGDKWRNVSGTAISSGIMLGVIALLYDKWQVEIQGPYANSLIMNNLILSNLTRFSGVTYPNRGQGYGVFEVSKLPGLLVTPIN